MDSQPNCSSTALPAHDDVDPFLKEVLMNPRHRLTVLRMEMDIKSFMLNSGQHQFEFQHFPTSYLRLAAHRVAQHYGLQSMVLDTGIDGIGSRIIVRKTPESRWPAIFLSEISPKEPDNDTAEQVKLAVRPRPRPSKSSQNIITEIGNKVSPIRTVEERKEEYEKARARIFSGSSSSSMDGSSPRSSSDRGSSCSIRDESVSSRNTTDDPEKYFTKESTSRVAIFRDMEKDRSDPDYDRSYDRYARSVHQNKNPSLEPSSLLQPPFIQYENGFPYLNQLPRAQIPMNYGPFNCTMIPFCGAGTAGFNQMPGDAMHFQWPCPSVMYAQSYEHFRHFVAQASYQQPLSFGYLQNH